MNQYPIYDNNTYRYTSIITVYVRNQREADNYKKLYGNSVRVFIAPEFLDKYKVKK